MHPAAFAAKGLKNFVAIQIERGTLGQTIKGTLKEKKLTLGGDNHLCNLIERQAAKYGKKTFLLYNDDRYSFQDMNMNANRVAHGLLALGAKPGDGVSIWTDNSPAYYDLFYAAQKLGMFSVPTNTAIRANGLIHLLTNAGVRFIVAHPTLIAPLLTVRDQVPELETIIVDDREVEPPDELPDDCVLLTSLYDEKLPITTPAERPTSGDVAMIMYTSGTTGLPKGVVYRFGDAMMGMMEVLGRTMSEPSDVMYTCLPLYHANALFVTSLTAMGGGCAVGLDKRFSASKFWDRCRFYKATTYNLLGAMIPILMKQPEKPNDRDHNVKRIVTSACPADLWEKFERRFGVEIWEGYGAVDGGGILIMNIGNAPKGSIGKPFGAKCRLVQDDGTDAPTGERGELWIQARKGNNKSDGSVEYYKNEEATEKKVKDGWIRTGDYLYEDEKGFMYFVGRDSESMRRRGENVSTYEVEVEINKHPTVQECAVYGVPAELGEDDVMCSLIEAPEKTADPKELIKFLDDKLAYFAVPRYWRITDELPKTGTHRVIKSQLQELGVTDDTFDAEKEGVAAKKKA